MKIQNTSMEFVAFDDCDVIATSGAPSLAWIRPDALPDFGGVESGMAIYGGCFIFYKDSGGEFYTSALADVGYQLVPNNGINGYAETIYTLVISGEGTEGAQITTFEALDAWLANYGVPKQ